MIDRLRSVLDADPRIAFALVFGSQVRGSAHAQSDVDIAIGLVEGARLDTLEVGELISRLESVAGRAVDLVLLDEAPPGLAFRVVRDGRVILVRDRLALTARRARAILDYLDFQPIEDLCVRGVLAARDGR